MNLRLKLKFYVFFKNSIIKAICYCYGVVVFNDLEIVMFFY